MTAESVGTRDCRYHRPLAPETAGAEKTAAELGHRRLHALETWQKRLQARECSHHRQLDPETASIRDYRPETEAKETAVTRDCWHQRLKTRDCRQQGQQSPETARTKDYMRRDRHHIQRH